MIDYYNRQIDTDERLTDALVEMQAHIRKGEILGAKGSRAGTIGISITDTLKKYGVTDNLSPFVSAFDFGKRINASRVARERATFNRREIIRWVLAHPDKAQAEVAEREPKKAGRPKAADRPQPVKAVKSQIPEVRLYDFHLLNSMRTLQLTWRVRTERGYEVHTTTHALEPQVYTYEAGVSPKGEPTVKRTYVSGDFKTGKLTEAAMARIAQEGREQMKARVPGRRLECKDDTANRFRFLMR